MKTLTIDNKKINDGKKVLLSLIIFFGLIFSANAILIYLAVTTNDGLVEDNYYNRALNYKSDESYQKMLDWNITFENKSLNLDNVSYQLTALDNKGSLINNADVKLNFFRPTQSGYDKTIVLKEISSGVYSGGTKLPLLGIWDIHIEITKDNKIWKKKERISIIR